MLLGAVQDNLASLLEILDDYFVGVFHIDALVLWNLFRELAAFVEWDRWVVGVDEFLLNAKFIIVLAEPRGAVNDARACIAGNEIAGQHFEASVFLSLDKEIEQWHVLHSFESASLELLQNLKLLFFLLGVESGESAFSHDEDLVPFQVLDFHIVEVRIDGES